MEMILDHEYHVVELNYAVRLLPEMVVWLEDRFGQSDRWFYMKNKIYFKNSNDHLMFLLRWASE